MEEFRDDAIVLRTYKSGESDRIAVLWTKDHGKVRVIAKGARKTTSRLGGSLEVMAYVNVDLVKSRGDFYVIRNVKHLERLATLRGSYERITAGYAVVEAVDAIPTEFSSDPELFGLLTRVLLTLDMEEFSPTLVPASFFFKLLAHDGSEPVVDCCVNCGEEDGLIAFNAETGGVLCKKCRSGHSLSSGGLDLLRRILGGDLANVLREKDLPAAGEIMTLAQESVEIHLGRRLKAPRATPALQPREVDR